jgi:WD domain, G-beta repeat
VQCRMLEGHAYAISMAGLEPWPCVEISHSGAEKRTMLFMGMRGRFSWRRAAAAVLIALLVLGLGFVLRNAGLGAAANVAQLVALAPLIGGVVAWARTRRRARPETSAPSITFGEFLRVIADAQGLTGRDLCARMPAWDVAAIDAYMDGRLDPTWGFVINFLDVIAADEPWRREVLERRLRPVWDAIAGHQPPDRILVKVVPGGTAEVLSNDEWFTALKQVSKSRQVLVLLQRSVGRHEGLSAALADMLARLSQAVTSLMNERDRLRAELDARRIYTPDGKASLRTPKELDDLRGQLRDTQERLRFAEDARKATAQRLEESERQRRLAERLRDEALCQVARAGRRLAELEGRPAALPSAPVGQHVTEDSESVLMGEVDQYVAEEVLRQVDEILQGEEKALDQLEGQLGGPSGLVTVPDDEKPGTASQTSPARFTWSRMRVWLPATVAAGVATALITFLSGDTRQPTSSPTSSVSISASIATILQNPVLSPAAVAFGPGAKTVAVGSMSTEPVDGATYVWDVASDEITATLTDPRSAGVESVAFSPTGTTLATADLNGSTYLWNIATGRIIATLTNPGGRVESVAFSPAGTSLATADSNGSTYLWNIATRRITATLTDPATGGVYSVAFSPGRTTLATGADDGSTYLWNIVSKKIIAILTDPSDPASPGSDVAGVAFGSGGTMLATADVYGSTYVWKVVSHPLRSG